METAEDEVIERVVANVVKAAVVLICPYTFPNWFLLVRFHTSSNLENKKMWVHGFLTVQNCLAKRHDGSGVAKQRSPGATSARQDSGAPLGVAKEPGRDIPQIHERLDGVEQALGAGEAVAGVKGLPAVDVVDLAVELVGRPDGPVEGAAGHGERPQEDVAGVPDDEG